MEPIRVPRPPKQAFNKNRAVSDLLKAQIAHFQHLEAKLPEAHRAPLAPHELTTESAAANYIAHMTSILCTGAEADVQRASGRKTKKSHAKRAKRETSKTAAKTKSEDAKTVTKSKKKTQSKRKKRSRVARA